MAAAENPRLPSQRQGVSAVRRLTGGGGRFRVGDLTAIGAETEAGRGSTESCSLTEVDRATGAVGPETVAAQVAKPEVVRSEAAKPDVGVALTKLRQQP